MEKRLFVGMDESFQALREKVDAYIDVESWPYGKKVRIELPRDFPNYLERLEPRMKKSRATNEKK